MARPPADACPYPRPFPDGFAECPLYDGERYVPADSKESPLGPIWTCCQLVTLPFQSGRRRASLRGMPVWRPRGQTAPDIGYHSQAPRRSAIKGQLEPGSPPLEPEPGRSAVPYSIPFRLEGIDLNDVDPQKAAGEAVDPDRLLEGEDPETPHAEEASHWVEVYSELMTFKDRAVATAHRNLGQMPEADARVETTRTDLAVLEAERDRIRRRLEFWKRRHLDLSTP